MTDGGESFTVSVRDARLYGLEEGAEISASVLSLIREQLRKEILHESGILLGGRDYTEKRLTEKLLERDYPEDLVQEAVQSLKEARYLDDRRFAEQYLSAHLSDRSIARIRQDLAQRGVDNKLIDEAVSACSVEEIQEEELAQIRQLLKKRHYDPESADYAEQQKTAAFLYRRGFDAGLIRKAMRT
ncbi:MAG: regulatory protein RecX [Lachnospiraceae bacterium]|nr:regulatory protein RecX [Lachnospiraceae bacterium]